MQRDTIIPQSNSDPHFRGQPQSMPKGQLSSHLFSVQLMHHELEQCESDYRSVRYIYS